MVGPLRYLTILWPGLPWLWLRGSLPGLVLALAFAVTLDVAMLTTFIWTDLVDPSFRVVAWSAGTAIWLLGTLSALAAFPPVLPVGRSPSIDARFEAARNAYLARDWIGAEQRLREMLRLAPTDGEAQLLLATLLRRVGRVVEARAALEALARSDAGARWETAIARELSLVGAAQRGPAEPAADPAADPTILPLTPAAPPAADRVAA